MKEIILHIGHGKTGSSYLQSFLALNIDKLLDLGIDYPQDPSFEKAKIGEITSGNPSVFFKNYLNLESITDQEKILFSNEAFVRKLIINTEVQRICNFLNTSKPALSDLKEFEEIKFIKFLEKYGKRLKVILFTRDLFQIRFSTWAQLVKRSSLISDVDTFLRERPIENHHILTYDWINLSKQFGFQLKIKNYSNHKDNLINVFLEDLIGEKTKIENFILPKNAKVNRSLTFSECEVQRICNFLNTSKPALSDLLVNQFPDLKSMDLKCSIKTYNIVKNTNIEMINNINNQIDKNESIVIESPEDVVSDDNDQINSALSIDQIKIIGSYLKENLNKENSQSVQLNDNYINKVRDIALKITNKESIKEVKVDKLYINQIRDIALKIANNQSLDLSNALSLMKIAKEFRPNGSLIKSKVEEWEKELEGGVKN